MIWWFLDVEILDKDQEKMVHKDPKEKGNFESKLSSGIKWYIDIIPK